MRVCERVCVLCYIYIYIYMYIIYIYMLYIHHTHTHTHIPDQAVQQTVAGIEERLAAMLGVPIPSKAERIMENKRLEMIGEVLSHARIHVPCVVRVLHVVCMCIVLCK